VLADVGAAPAKVREKSSCQIAYKVNPDVLLGLYGHVRIKFEISPWFEVSVVDHPPNIFLLFVGFDGLVNDPPVAKDAELTEDPPLTSKITVFVFAVQVAVKVTFAVTEPADG
jgi:hypothetical protein